VVGQAAQPKRDAGYELFPFIISEFRTGSSCMTKTAPFYSTAKQKHYAFLVGFFRSYLQSTLRYASSAISD